MRPTRHTMRTLMDSVATGPATVVNDATGQPHVVVQCPTCARLCVVEDAPQLCECGEVLALDAVRAA